MKGKSRLIILIDFYDESTSVVDNGMSFLFSKAFKTVSHDSILTVKLIKYGLNKWTVRWPGHRLDCQAQRVMISRLKSSWKPATTNKLQQIKD